MVNNQVLKEFLKKRFQVNSFNCGPYAYWRLNLGLEQTPIYNALMPIPKAPIFHPYNPTGTTNEQMKNGTGGIPGVILTVKLDNEVLQYLPEPIKNVISDNKIAKENIDCFFVTQNMPWKNEPLLIRPNYWLHGDKKLHDEAAKAHTLNATTACRVGIFSASTANITIDNTKEALSSKDLNFVSHPGEDANKTAMTIVSPDGIGIMAGIDFNRTDSLFSVVLAGNRLAITLHWLLDDIDQGLLTNMSHYVKNVDELIDSIQTLPNSRLNEKNGPLSHLQQILNVSSKPNPKDHKDNKHSDVAGKALTGKEDVNIEDPKVQLELLKQFEDKAAKRKEQEALLKQFLNVSSKPNPKDHQDNKHSAVAGKTVTSMEDVNVEDPKVQLELLKQFEDKAAYETHIFELKQKQTKINKLIDALIELQNVRKDQKEKSEDMEIFLQMAFQVSEVIRLSLIDDPAKRDQSKLDSMIKNMPYINKRMGELEECIKKLKILPVVMSEPKPIAGISASTSTSTSTSTSASASASTSTSASASASIKSK